MKQILVISYFILSSACLAQGVVPNWSSARKTNVGTSLDIDNNKKSLVWFTNADGILTETYYPTIDQAQIKDSQIVVSDGDKFFADEKYNTVKEVQVISPSLIKLVNKHSKFHISHTFYTAPDKSVVIDEIEIKTFVDGLDFYLLTNPALNNTGFGDSAQLYDDYAHIYEGNTNLFIHSTTGFLKQSVGYVGVDDGHKQLREQRKLSSLSKNIENGNIASTLQLNIPAKSGVYKFYVTYSFKDNVKHSAYQLAGYKEAYEKIWSDYFSSLKKPKFASASQELLYYRSIYTLKVHEDKLNPGALIASLSKPWGEELFEHPGVFTGGYHLVWPRDLFHVSLALISAGDLKSPESALSFLKRVQYQSGEWNFDNQRVIPKKGAFPQNVWTNLNEYWGGLQIDQVGYPILLFWNLYKISDASKKQELLNNYGAMIRMASDFILNYGPWSAQERWEENFGISPSSFAAATSALIVSSKIFNDAKYENTANAWLHKPNDNIHTWTFTNSGVYGDGKYYLRVAGCSAFNTQWNPDTNDFCTIANSGRQVMMKEVLDQGFLQLSLLGLVPATDARINTSLAKVNGNIRVKFQDKYFGWYRYSFDAYGENKKGRLWPLLSGEHARFEIQKFQERKSEWSKTQKFVDNILESYEFFANDGLMIPEQVFEESGIGTGAATPLAWSHAEFVKLIWSKELQKNIENPL